MRNWRLLGGGAEAQTQGEYLDQLTAAVGENLDVFPLRLVASAVTNVPAGNAVVTNEKLALPSPSVFTSELPRYVLPSAATADAAGSAKTAAYRPSSRRC